MILRADKDFIEINETVTVPLKDYDNMRSKAEQFDNIVALAFHGAKLGYFKDSIDLDMSAAETLIKSLFFERCDLELRFLRAQEGLENE